MDTIIAADQTTQAHLAKLAAEINQKQLEDQVAFATLVLEFREGEKIHSTTNAGIDALIAQDRRADFCARFGESIVAGWYGFLETVLSLAKFWTLLFLLPLLWLIFEGVRRFFTFRTKNPKKPDTSAFKVSDSNPPSS